MPEKNNIRLRIAMLGHKRIPSREGGVEIVVEELSTRMSALGYSVTCFNRSGHHISGKEFDSQKLSEYKGVSIKRVFTIKKGGLAAMSASFFAAVKVAFGKFDIAHFHAEGPCAMLWLPKLFGKRCIATIHGLDHKRAKWGRLASLYIKLGEKCAVRFADEIIVLSQSVQNYFQEKYGRKTVFIPNGVNRAVNISADEITKKYGIEKNGYILFLGRLVPEKGIEYLIKAFKQVNTNKKLIISGGASDSGDFEKGLKITSMDDGRIIFTGFVQGKVLEELYSNAYIYVLPSDLEGMPLSLLEAMSYGNCCLTSDISECADVIGGNGVTFKKGNVNDLAEKLQELCDNSDKVESLKSDTADFVCSKYNWDNVVNRTLELYGVDKCEKNHASVAEEKQNESFAYK